MAVRRHRWIPRSVALELARTAGRSRGLRLSSRANCMATLHAQSPCAACFGRSSAMTDAGDCGATRASDCVSSSVKCDFISADKREGIAAKKVAYYTLGRTDQVREALRPFSERIYGRDQLRRGGFFSSRRHGWRPLFPPARLRRPARTGRRPRKLECNRSRYPPMSPNGHCALRSPTLFLARMKSISAPKTGLWIKSKAAGAIYVATYKIKTRSDPRPGASVRRAGAGHTASRSRRPGTPAAPCARRTARAVARARARPAASRSSAPDRRA